MLYGGLWYGYYGLNPLQVIKAYLGIALLIIFIVSAVISFSELSYLAFGRVTNAVLLEDADSIGRLEKSFTGSSGSPSFTVAIRYGFYDTDGTLRTESDRVAQAWHTQHANDFIAVVPGAANADIKGSNGLTVPVQYIPGDPKRSRLLGHNYAWLTIPFAAATLALIGFTAWVWHDVQKFERHKALKDQGH